jgi:5-methylcytosine-specific restriction endonuclease McrA
MEGMYEDYRRTEGLRCFGFPRSSLWDELQREWRRYYPACAACGSLVGVEVHHLVPFWKEPKLELCWENLQSLCRPRGCHFRVGHAYSWRMWNPFAREDAGRELSRIRTRRGE